MEDKWDLFTKIWAGVLYGSIVMGIVMLAWPRPWIKKPKPSKKELVIPWKQLLFYILAVVCFFLALSSGLINFLFWTLGFAVFSLWWSDGWFYLKKESKKSRVLKVYIPITLYRWMAEPFIAWEMINRGIFTSEISYKRVMKGVFIFGISIFLLIIAIAIYYVVVESKTRGAV